MTTDRKLQYDDGTPDGIVDRYIPEISAWYDYYAFGSTAEVGILITDQRYGFNGMEKGSLISSGAYEADFRLVDTRIGRWFSIDPVEHPFQSGYVAFNNNPVYYADPSGLEGENTTVKRQGDYTQKGRKQDRKDLPNNPTANQTITYEYEDGSITTYKYNSEAGNWDETRSKTTEFGTYTASTTYKKPSAGIIFVVFPKDKAKIGSEDQSPLARLARKIFGPDKEYKVGHAGVIIYDENGTTTYADFGRFDGAPPGYGVTRIGGSNLATSTGEFDDKTGNLKNAHDVVRSLTQKGNYFSDHKKGGLIEYASIGGLDYMAMKSYIESTGTMKFGFDAGSNYCAQFAYNTCIAGGATLKVWNIQDLMNTANGIIDKWGALGVPKAIKLINDGPTPANIVDDIKSRYSGASGPFRY